MRLPAGNVRRILCNDWRRYFSNCKQRRLQTFRPSSLDPAISTRDHLGATPILVTESSQRPSLCTKRLVVTNKAPHVTSLFLSAFSVPET